MGATTVEKELIDLETQYWQAMKDKDADTAMRLTDDVCLLTGGQGAMALPRDHFREVLSQTDAARVTPRRNKLRAQRA